jgi:hypothetical protein
VGRAQRGDPFSQPSGSSACWADVLTASTFEPKGADQIAPALLPPARFSWSGMLLPDALVFDKRAGSPARRPSRHRRDQKTFSAGPRSFNTKELWFPGNSSASGVQPVCDSRHGRIACKVSLSCTNIYCKESSRLQSNHRDLCPTPLLAGDCPQIQLRFIVLIKSLREQPSPINPQGSTVQPLCWLAAALKFKSQSFFIVWVASCGNIRCSS